jgi:preprotein translocase subunit SecY
MSKIFDYIRDIFANKSLKKKILYTIWLLALYRFLVIVPVPFVDIAVLNEWAINTGWWLEFFAMLMWWALQSFSIIAVWLMPYINASIIMQLLTAVLPQLQELQELWEQWQTKIQQYTRWLTFPLAFLQSIGMVYFMNYMLWWNLIDTTNFSIVLLTAVILSIGTMLLVWLWELMTEKWVSNWISLIIFASIVSWITSKVYTFLWTWTQFLNILLFMIVIVLVLVILSILLVKTRKDIPIVYSRQWWKIEDTASLPIPLNPVWMIPIIFAIAFVTFPYLISEVIVKFWWSRAADWWIWHWIQTNFNIYTQQPSVVVIFFYFVLIVLFTFFYSLITFNPEKMADNIQKRWWFIPWIRPWEETAKYINDTLMHLCLWGGVWLWFIWIYTYILNYLPFIQNAVQSLWSIPVVVSGAWVIIIVWVVQEFINKINADLLMEKYSQI